jgi:hypothetical protein
MHQDKPKTTEDIRKILINKATDTGMSGYAIAKYMKDKSMPNSSGARLYLGGKFKSITTQTLLNMCEALSLEVVLVDKGGSPRKTKKTERTAWDWQNHENSYSRLLEEGGNEQCF